MSSTKDIDLKAQARERAEELRVAKLIAEYNPKADGILPPELAPREYALTTSNPSSYPLSLTALSSKFKGSGNLLSLLGKAVDVPTSPPLAISDYDGKGTNYRVNGRINIDRFDSLEGAGLFPKPSHTWDRNDNTFYPSSTTITGNPYRHALCNSWEFLAWLQATGKVTNIRTLTMGFRRTDTRDHRHMVYTGYYYTNPSTIADLTMRLGAFGYGADTMLAHETDLVKNSFPQAPVLSSIGTNEQRMAACRSHIENGFLCRLSMDSLDNIGTQLTDFYMDADFDVVAR